MDYDTLKQTLRGYSSRDLEQRAQWYSPAAAAYDRVRPKYPEALIRQVAAIAHLTPSSRILEIGCGPGTATVSFAALGCELLCLEPNPEFYRLAQYNCQGYPRVEIQNTSFEEWQPGAEKFDAVLAASSFHWIAPEVGYPKAAAVLQDKAHLILLWNKELQPDYALYQKLSAIYQVHAPALDRYEDRPTQERILQGLGSLAIESGHFQALVTGSMASDVIYTVDEYLDLLDTYSPYLKLDPRTKAALFAGLRDEIDRNGEGGLALSYISAFHIAPKCLEAEALG